MPQERPSELLQEISDKLSRLLPPHLLPSDAAAAGREVESADALSDDPDNPVILPGGAWRRRMRRSSVSPAEGELAQSAGTGDAPESGATGGEGDPTARDAARDTADQLAAAELGPGDIPADLRVVDKQEVEGESAAEAARVLLPLPLLARMRARGLFEDDWRARPTTEHPYPVICIHGTGTTKGDWQELGEDLRAEGYAVFAPDFGNRATDSIAESASQIGAYIDVVLQATGAQQVILIGHSQGGTLARYWMRLMGGAPKVRHLVCLAAPNHGTTLGGVVSPLVRTAMAENIMNSLVNNWFGSSGFEQVTGHPTITAINEGGDLDPGVSYTCIATRGDTVIQPPETCFLYPDEDELGDETVDELGTERVHNIWIQDRYPRAVILHADLPQDSRVRQIIRAELAQVR
ncbi:Extracellular esterase EstB precursor [Corynebacterium occultum]|uniref:Extracellular esterase EstB n=1 Tax=Corynebacterium occultum TaxID=2675219 RepID=A0A6B8W256_9CORY|nr:triacylglycerol lipase [Corynebacterium occultum]QGU06097.1 Extracellular esterase EstB precursor [Corynebacterium occultum]